MLLTIHNLPMQIRYADIKALLLSKCGLSEVILDKLENEGNTKKVTVGLAEEEDAAILTRTINGLYFEGKQLNVRDVRQKMAANQQPYYKSVPNSGQSQLNQQPPVNYPPPMNEYQAYQGQVLQPGVFGNHTQQFMGQEGMMPMMVPGMVGGMYYMPQFQNSFVDYKPPQASSEGQQAASSQYSQLPGKQQSHGGSAYQDGRSRDNVPNADRASYGDDRERNQFDRTKSRWNETERKERDLPNRSKSPYQKDRYRDFSQDNRNQSRKYDYHYRGEGRDSKGHGSQGHSSGRNETYSSRTRDDFQNSSVNQKLMSLSNSRQPNEYNKPPYFGNEAQNKSSYNQSTFDNYNQSQETNDWKGQDSQGRNDYWTQQSSYGNNSEERNKWNTQNRFSNQNQSQSSWNRGANNSDDNGSHQQNRWGASSSFENKPRFPNDRSPATASDNQVQNKNSVPFENVTRPNVKIWENSNRKANPQPEWSFNTHNDSGNSTQTRAEARFNRPNQPPANFQERSRRRPVERPSRSMQHKTKSRNERLKGDSNAVSERIRKDTSCRFEATNIIMKQMKASAVMENTHMNRHVKKSIRTRLEVLLADKIVMNAAAMVNLYRKKFPQSLDRELYESVLLMKDPVTRKNANPDAKIDETVAAALAPKSHIQGQNVPKIVKKDTKIKIDKGPTAVPQQKPVVADLPPIMQPTDKIPKYVNADKKVYKAIKVRQKEEHKEDNYYHDQMQADHPLEEAELIKEADAICNIVINILDNPDLESEKGICRKILEKTVPQLKKTVILNITKRILNITTGLMVRVFASGVFPRKPEVEKFLSQFDIVALKKSVKRQVMYVAHCSSHQMYDYLLHSGTLPMNDQTSLIFKPFQVVGPKLSVREKKEIIRKMREESGIIHTEIGDNEAEQEGDFNFTDNENVDRIDQEELIDLMEAAKEDYKAEEGGEHPDMDQMDDVDLDDENFEDW